MRPSVWPRGEPADTTSRAMLNFVSSREEAFRRGKFCLRCDVPLA
jgi:hypothetical protein